MERIGRPRLHLRVTSSTNERARELAAAGAPHGTLVTAAEQTAGRGRQGRTWAGPPGQVLLFSVVLRALDPLLPLRAGLAVADVAGASARVKWPNDVLLDGRKVAGVLVEAQPQNGWAVLGIGVNVAVELGALPAELRKTAGSLGRSADDLEPVLHEVLAALEARLREPAAATVTALRSRDALRDRELSWAGGTGTGAGIDEAGRLVVRLADASTTALEAGEVHLRLASEAMDLPTGRITIPKDVVRRAFGEDKVLLNLGTGHYHGLNPTGGYMVALLDETGDAAETARRTAEELKAPLETVTADLAQLCDELEQRGLIEIDRA